MRFTTLFAAVLLFPLLQPVASAQTSDGIQVRGHWSITVRNDDGTVAQHYELENALYNNGERLARIPTHQYTPGLWGVAFNHSQGEASLCTGFCDIWEPPATDIYPTPFRSLNLAVTRNAQQAIVLSGSRRMQQAGPIT